MSNKKCLVFETLGKVSDLKVVESKSNDALMRLSGVFGVCGVRNNNNRIYDKKNYAQMVESLQKVIKEQGCPGELEHPNSMNINLENVSHKIESIQMNEDGTITGTIALLNTPKGKLAQAIVEGGLPLFISSRAAGTMTNESGVSHVTLSTIKTYDLVGTPGFSQAKLTLKENQTLECLNESVDDGNVIYAIVEDDDLLGGGDDSDDKKKDDKKKDKKDDDLLGGGDSEDKKKDSKDKDSEDKDSKDKDSDDKDKDSEDKDKDSEDKDKDSDNKKKETTENNKKNNDIDMKDLKDAIEKLADKVTSLEAELHITKESLKDTRLSIPSINYNAIQQWVTEEFAPEFKDELMESMESNDDIEDKINEAINDAISTISNGVQNWVCEEFAPEVQNWVCEEFAPEVQNWVCEEFAPEVQGWITEEFAPEVQNWVCEEFAPEVQNWITEEYSPEVQGWITEEFAPEVQNWITEEFAPVVDNWITEEVTPNIIESHNSGRLEEIDSLLETISSNNTPLEDIIKENKEENKWKGIYVVEHMPAQYKPSWNMISESKQQEIVRASKMYDLTRPGVLESFWASQKFDEDNKEKNINESVDVISNYHSMIANRMRALRQ